MVVPSTYHLRGTRGLGHLRDRPRLYAQVVFRVGLPLPHAVLLTVSDRPVRRGLGRVRHTAAERLVHPRGRVHAAVPAAVPADLLLLPEGVLPRLLAVAAGLRGARRAPEIHR